MSPAVEITKQIVEGIVAIAFFYFMYKFMKDDL